ncbi:MAG: M24 family metallopeptidase, partial [Dethiobacter sp.]|nr:M24 family metallopeptidase [Dethiobacter sp.]MBS3898405.1 M24 family metallopeptidase [Dethiobacter sp.]
EFPILAKGSQHLLAENMVVAVEPKFTFPDKGVVGIENTWQVLKEGPRKICITADTHVVL